MSLTRTNRKSLNRRIAKYVKFVLTNSQVNSLNGTPITVIPAPGAGLVTIIDACYCTTVAGTAYTIGSATGMVLKYTNASGTSATGTIAVTGWLDQAAGGQSFGDAATAVIPVANAAIVANMLTANVSAGASPVSLRIYYKTLPAAL